VLTLDLQQEGFGGYVRDGTHELYVQLELLLIVDGRFSMLLMMQIIQLTCLM